MGSLALVLNAVVSQEDMVLTPLCVYGLNVNSLAVLKFVKGALLGEFIIYYFEGREGGREGRRGGEGGREGGEGGEGRGGEERRGEERRGEERRGKGGREGGREGGRVGVKKREWTSMGEVRH